MVEVILAGFNIPKNAIDALLSYEHIDPATLTPDVITTAFAWASHYDKPLEQLLTKALHDVAHARKKAKYILFKLGHKSVAEHGIFNFIIKDLSRYATEFLQMNRIGMGVTEKSQRYQKMVGGGFVIPEELFVIPEELNDFPELKKDFIYIIKRQIEAYREIYPKVLKKLKEENPGVDEKKLEKITNEDTRYVLGLSTKTQMGISPNARTLEHIIRKFRYHSVYELRELSNKLYESAISIAPGEIILTDPDKFYQQYGVFPADDFLHYGKEDIKRASRLDNTKRINKNTDKLSIDDVTLISHDSDGEAKIIATMLFENTTLDFSSCKERADEMIKNKRAKDYMKECFQHLTKYDSMPKAFEQVYFTFSITISASAFAQLKRHRMMTLVTQPYDPQLGYRIPNTFLKTPGVEEIFSTLMNETDKLFYRIYEKLPDIAPYILTNAHKRQLLLTLNLRELYHIARLRMDKHAQWDIKERCVKPMVEIVKKLMPSTTIFLSGKHEFDKIKSRLYLVS